MSMKALNQLVARSIIDPNVVNAFNAGNIGAVISDFDFSNRLVSLLGEVEAGSFAEFSVQAYRLVKEAELANETNRLPSPLEGLLSDGDAAANEQVA